MKKKENEKYTFSRKQKWLKPSKIFIFGAKTKINFGQSLDITNDYRSLTCNHL